MTDEELMEVLDGAVGAVRAALLDVDDWRPRTSRPGQYEIDLVADAAAVEVLVEAGLGVLSEESGHHHPDRDIVVVVDPVDGSTNASRGIPWYATSVCAVDSGGARAAVVTNLATGERFDAVRGGGARRDGVAIRPSDVADLGDAVVALSGMPDRGRGGWRQFRALGAVALDLCAVACGRFDAYVDLSEPSAHGPWDYLGGMLVCGEAGAVVVDAHDRPLTVLDHRARRSPLAAANRQLLGHLHVIRGAAPARP